MKERVNKKSLGEFSTVTPTTTSNTYLRQQVFQENTSTKIDDIKTSHFVAMNIWGFSIAFLNIGNI